MDQRKALRKYFKMFRDDREELKAALLNHHNLISVKEVKPIIEHLSALFEDFPSLVAPLTMVPREDRYDTQNLIFHLNGAIAALEVEFENEPSFDVEANEFTFIVDSKLRAILVRDFRDLQVTFSTGCWKSAIMLAGGAIEAILLDLLSRRDKEAKAANGAPAKNKNNLSRWSLSELIDVSVELALVNPGVDALSHSIRSYRNLVHPGNETRNGLRAEREEAKIAYEVLKMIIRDL